MNQSLQEEKLLLVNMSDIQRLKIYLIRIMAILFAIVYFKELNWIAITSGDFGLGPKILGLGVAGVCNLGLWLATVSMTKFFKVFVLILLLPTFFVTPFLLQSQVHVFLSGVAILIAALAVHTLFSGGRDA